MKYILPVFFFLSFNSFTFLYSQTPQTLQIEFERYYREKNVEEIEEGTIYYKTPDNITVIVKKPVNQWMILRSKGMDLYYPTDKKAFRFNTKKPVPLPFMEAFLGVVKRDYGLIDIGYILCNRKINAETLITHWSPPKKLSKVLGDFTLIYVSDKLIYAESKKVDGTIMNKSSYSNHFHHGETYYPLEICTVRYTNPDSTIEKITFSKPQFNCEFPESIKCFNIPTYVKIKKIEW